MYAKLCNIEILSSYIKDVSVGDVLTIQALITNPLDWQHFYEKLSTIKKGERTDFTVVTSEGDRLVGYGNIAELERWSDRSKFGFKIKIDILKQKSLTDRRVRGAGRMVVPKVNIEELSGKPQDIAPEIIRRPKMEMGLESISVEDMSAFKELLKSSLSMDISSQSSA